MSQDLQPRALWFSWALPLKRLEDHLESAGVAVTSVDSESCWPGSEAWSTSSV